MLTGRAPRRAGVAFTIQVSTDGRRRRTVAARLPARTRTWLDRLPPSHRPIRYRVRAVAAGGRSAWSVPVRVRRR